LDTRPLPEVIAASRRHRRLARRHGELCSSRLWASVYVTRRWVEKGYFTEQFDARLELLGCEPKVTWWSPVSAPAETIIYPDAVALAGMFIAPYWRAAAKRGSPEFFAEAARRLRLPLPGGHL
jgi:hypothetical protein